jgi:hypothetical protein
MDEFITNLIQVVNTSGGFVVRVFPSESSVLLLFAERLANDVVSQFTRNVTLALKAEGDAR